MDTTNCHHLTKHDILEYESFLSTRLRSLVGATNATISFPGADARQKTLLSPPQAHLDGTILHLPLVQNKHLLALFSAEPSCPEELTPLLPALPRWGELCLEQVALHKQARSDLQTPLKNRRAFFELLQKELRGIEYSFNQGQEAMPDDALTSHSACFGLILLDIDGFQHINKNYGHLFADTVLLRCAEVLQQYCPVQSKLFRLEDDTFAVLYPQASRIKTEQLCQDLAKNLRTLTVHYTPLRQDVHFSCCLGSLNYPQDFQGGQLAQIPEEQSYLVLQKAHQAIKAAQNNGPGSICPFRDILHCGGKILDLLPMNRVRINLGRSVDTQEGQHFLLWGMPSSASKELVYKGELSIIETTEQNAIAEILYQNDPTAPVAIGDQLTLSGSSQIPEKNCPQNQKASLVFDSSTKLYCYRDFLRQWNARHRHAAQFSMLLIHLPPQTTLQSPEEQAQTEIFLCQIAQAIAAQTGSEMLGGRYSATCLVYSLPQKEPNHCIQILRSSLEPLIQAQRVFSVGISYHPFLDSPPSKCLENAQKALAHANLLSTERIVCVDSISLTIHADKLFTYGQFYEALAEYTQALELDASNILSKNSLGVCHACLGDYQKARELFQEILDLHPEHSPALYNYGCACLKEGDVHAAAQSFTAVLRVQPENSYARMRLGMLAEEQGRLEEARNFYDFVRKLPHAKHLAYAALGRLALSEGDKTSAQELLHQAVTANPRDAFSFHLLGKLYLERGDDPEIAESLARQSVHLKNDQPAFWALLQACLRKQGKYDEAELINIPSHRKKSIDKERKLP